MILIYEVFKKDKYIKTEVDITPQDDITFPFLMLLNTKDLIGVIEMF